MKLKNIQYTRKSTEDKERQVQSHEDQSKENEKMALEYEVNIDLTFSDSKSAKKPYLRDDFTKMMNLIFSEGIGYLFCWRINRLARNMLEAGMIIEALQSGLIQKIITPERVYLPTDNVVLIAIDFGIAKEDIKKLSSDVKRGLRGKVTQGWRPGNAVIGYINDKYGTKGSKELFPDPERFDKVKFLLHEALTGKYSYMELLRKGIEIGLTPRPRRKTRGVLSKSTVIGMIKNPFYAGKYWFNGELQTGKHEPMITWSEYEKLQLIFGRKDKSRNSKHDNEYNGIFKCGHCGFSITPEPLKKKVIKSTGETRFYKYWRCTHKNSDIECHQRSITEKDIKDQMDLYLEDVELGDELIKWGMSHIETYAKGEIQFRQTIHKERSRQFEEASFSLDNLVKTYFGPANSKHELLTEAEYIAQKKDMTAAKEKALIALEQVNDRQDQFIKEIEDDMEFCRLLVDRFNSGGNEEKKFIMNKLGRTVTIEDGKVSMVMNPPFEQFKKLKEQVLLNPSWLELTESNKEKNISMFEKIQTVISG